MGKRTVLRIRSTAIAVGIGIALWAAWPSAQSAIGNFKRIVFSPVDAKTIASDGTGAAATYTLTPTGSYVTVTNNDPDGATITMGEPSGVSGMPVTIVNIGSNPITFGYSSGVSELAGPAKLGQYDELDVQYISDRWVERGRKSIYAPVQLTASLHQTDAQIKAWPTTGNVEIVAASSGYAQVPLWGFLVCDATHGNYTNINGSSFLGITTNTNGGFGTAYMIESAGAGTKVSSLLAAGDLEQVTLPMYDRAELVGGEAVGVTVPATTYAGNIVLTIDNNGAGDFGGGSASNAGCDITVGYLRIKIPGL